MERSAFDRDCLAGRRGEPLRFAMDLLVRVGEAVGAERLIDVTRCHLVGAYDGGAANRRVLERLVGQGARVRVPTTLNASSACLAAGARGDPLERAQAAAMVDLYAALGCARTLTCAPYHLADPPRPGERIAWAESNAVVYANSVLGARTNHTVQYLDLAAALTGRIPEAGLYLDRARRATVEIDVSALASAAHRPGSFCALLGLWLGAQPGDQVPALTGLPADVGDDELRALGAAAASSGALGMFHVVGRTPEAPDLAGATGGRPVPRRCLAADELRPVAARFSAPDNAPLDAVCLGTPHYSLGELRALTERLECVSRRLRVPVAVTTSRHVLAAARREGLADVLARRGVTLLTDTCSYYGGVVPGLTGTVMTDSAKWAWYAGGNLGVRPVLADQADCLASALAGRVVRRAGTWLA